MRFCVHTWLATPAYADRDFLNAADPLNHTGKLQTGFLSFLIRIDKEHGLTARLGPLRVMRFTPHRACVAAVVLGWKKYLEGLILPWVVRRMLQRWFWGPSPFQAGQTLWPIINLKRMKTTKPLYLYTSSCFWDRKLWRAFGFYNLSVPESWISLQLYDGFVDSIDFL